MSVTEMVMFRVMSGVTKEGRIKNEFIRGSIEVTMIMEKIRKNRLSW